jgi:preprotein translocase subunit SecG
MNGWMTLLMVVQVLSAMAIIVLVLLQHGKGADMGAAFGSGASGSLFGASGAANFLSRSTGIAAAVFFVVTIGLAYGAGGLRGARSGLMAAPAAQSVPQQASPQAPGVPAPAAGPAAPAAPTDKSAGIPR